MTKEILCTLGPASMNEHVIARLEELGVTLFRINLSHTKLDDVADAIRFVTSLTRVPLSLDTEGAQIRTGDLTEPTFQMDENAIVRAHRETVPGNGKDFNFYPHGIISEFQVGDIISIDFNAVLVQVIDCTADTLSMRVLNGGKFGRNKAVTVDRPITMPALTEKDRAAVAIGVDLGVTHFALSFANSGKDVRELRTLTGKGSSIISKIECRNGVDNLEEIAELSDAILIDRGDLSREVPIELIPAYQKKIIKTAGAKNRKVYVATNLLESMVTEPVPTRAEVNDIYNTFLDGADGVVLAAETAIGQYPVRCANMVAKMINVFENRDDDETDRYHLDPVSLLPEPHGGALVHREAADGEALDGLPRLQVSARDLLDCQQIALGTYSPLTGFMDQATLESVLTKYQLNDGLAWTLPVVLQTMVEKTKAFAPGDRIALTSDSREAHAFMDVTEIYPLDFDKTAKALFETDARDHPGVQRLLAAGDMAVAGPVTLVNRIPSPWRHYQLFPAQTRFIFNQKGWSRVAGFYGEASSTQKLQNFHIDALASTKADGLYISPSIDPDAPGESQPDPVMESYQAALQSGIYPEGRVVLGGFAAYGRLSGPREMVFAALCLKNMGCGYFIPAASEDGTNAARDLFDRLGDIGITPVFPPKASTS
ncbi:MAG: sulfate adenylyltransferase [Rhodospirillales bacterium]|nr:sulfate adenylyltransferase [Rhodospirillales bacterium]